MQSCRNRPGSGSPSDVVEYSADGEWIGEELTGCSFPDARLGHRLRKLIEGVAGAVGKSLPMACQD